MVSWWHRGVRLVISWILAFVAKIINNTKTIKVLLRSSNTFAARNFLPSWARATSESMNMEECCRKYRVPMSTCAFLRLDSANFRNSHEFCAPKKDYFHSNLGLIKMHLIDIRGGLKFSFSWCNGKLISGLLSSSKNSVNDTTIIYLPESFSTKIILREEASSFFEIILKFDYQS